MDLKLKNIFTDNCLTCIKTGIHKGVKPHIVLQLAVYCGRL